MLINKDTKIYGSFSNSPGNNGCVFFNNAFEKFNLNCIYKSFFSNDIQKSISAAKELNFSGFAVSMPHKKTILNFLDYKDDSVEKIGACNTVVIENKKLYGYNTDWLAIHDFILNKNFKDKINIIGTGGFASAIMYALSKLNISFSIVDRNNIKNIDIVNDEYFINATPIEIVSSKNTIIDARPETQIGKEIAFIQAKYQFKIYTGLNYE